MSKLPGDVLYSTSLVITMDTDAANPDPDAGLAVTVNASGAAVPAGDGDDLEGVVSRGNVVPGGLDDLLEGSTIMGSGGRAPVLMDGVGVVKVAQGVTAGTRVGASLTSGELAAAAGGPYTALSDEGGRYETNDGSVDMPDGYAAVRVR